MGGIIECPKHNGRFDLADGSPARAPVCRGLRPIRSKSATAGCSSTSPAPAAPAPATQKTYRLRVVSNRNVATFIKELVLEPVMPADTSPSRPATTCSSTSRPTTTIRFRDFDIPEPYAAVWEAQHVFDLVAQQSRTARRRNNYSLASNPATERVLRFNVRIATPPPGQDCPPGVGSAYVFSLKPGDTVTAIGPFGDFHHQAHAEGNGLYRRRRRHGAAARAPRRTCSKPRRPPARSASGMGRARGRRFSIRTTSRDSPRRTRTSAFHLALSAPLPEDDWTGHTGSSTRSCWSKYLRSTRKLRGRRVLSLRPAA